MKLDEIVAWYQKKIGYYDKQPWEKTVEQRILYGFVHVPLKNTTLKTELIDVDLVRGSSFPKAKPKQTLLTVLRLSVLRFIFLPLYAKWWVEQTSTKIFTFFLCVYLVQMFNWGVYSYNINKIGQETEHKVSLSELIIPIALSMILSVIHSQIVATASNTSKTSDKQRQRHLHPKRKKRERVRRRKKNQRCLRTNETLTTSVTTNLDNDLLTSSLTTNDINLSSSKYNQNVRLCPSLSNSNILDLRKNLRNDFTLNIKKEYNEQTNEYDNQNDLLNSFNTTEEQDINDSCSTINNMELIEPQSSINLRKRNVNWDSPIKSQVTLSNFDHYIYPDDEIILFDQKDTDNQIDDLVQENLFEQKIDDVNNEINENIPENIIINNNDNILEQTGEDDGFESLNGKSSSGEENLTENQPNIFNMFNIDNIITQPQQQINKIPYRNAWIRDILENNVTNNNCNINTNNKISDSDTDTLKGNNNSTNNNNPTIISARKNSLSLPLTTNKTTNFKQNNIKLTLDTTDIDNKRKLITTTTSASSTTTSSNNNNLIKNQQTNFMNVLPKNHSSDTDEEDEDCETVSTPGTNSNPQLTEVTTSATEWIGVTTNSEECSYSSELDPSDSQNEYSENDVDYDFTPAYILNPICGVRISCTIWEHHEPKKAEMSVLDISSAIIEKVEGMPETCDYIYIGLTFSMFLSLIPAFCRLCEATIDLTNSTEVNFFDIPVLLLEKASFSSTRILWFAFGSANWESTILIVSFFLRLCLTFLFFFLLTVAERTFKQRFLYAKLFSHLTSSRRARKSELPHFRLNKVRNIKTWLSVRSYLKRRGPQRSVDVIVSSAFILTLLLLAFLSVEWLKDSVHLHSQFNLEALVWSSSLGIFLLRFMTLGTKINRKYRSISVLITEQINLYLQIEKKPQKKEELMVSNSVLKLAGDLLKELESPFKISGLSANPYLYTTIKVVILSALSGVLSEILGFKLKLHKIKIK